MIMICIWPRYITLSSRGHQQTLYWTSFYTRFSLNILKHFFRLYIGFPSSVLASCTVTVSWCPRPFMANECKPVFLVIPWWIYGALKRAEWDIVRSGSWWGQLGVCLWLGAEDWVLASAEGAVIAWLRVVGPARQSEWVLQNRGPVCQGSPYERWGGVLTMITPWWLVTNWCQKRTVGCIFIR